MPSSRRAARAARASVAADVDDTQSTRRTRMTVHDFDLFKGHIRWRDGVPVHVYEYPAGIVYEETDAVAFVQDLNRRWLAGRGRGQVGDSAHPDSDPSHGPL